MKDKSSNKELVVLVSLMSTVKDLVIDNKYEDRVVARTFKNGLIISTAFTPDEGFETAILDGVGTYPVERYTGKSMARAGHIKWVERVEVGLTRVTKLVPTIWPYDENDEDSVRELVPNLTHDNLAGN